MKVSVDVYTKDIKAGTEAFQAALAAGATDVRLQSNEDWETKKFEHLNLMFEVDHSNAVMNILDAGPFVKDSSDL